MGFKVLLNENIKIKKGTSYISLIGVENWGKGGLEKVQTWQRHVKESRTVILK